MLPDDPRIDFQGKTWEQIHEDDNDEDDTE